MVTQPPDGPTNRAINPPAGSIRGSTSNIVLGIPLSAHAMAVPDLRIASNQSRIMGDGAAVNRIPMLSAGGCRDHCGKRARAEDSETTIVPSIGRRLASKGIHHQIDAEPGVIHGIETLGFRMVIPL